MCATYKNPVIARHLRTHFQKAVWIIGILAAMVCQQDTAGIIESHFGFEARVAVGRGADLRRHQAAALDSADAVEVIVRGVRTSRAVHAVADLCIQPDAVSRLQRCVACQRDRSVILTRTLVK